MQQIFCYRWEHSGYCELYPEEFGLPPNQSENTSNVYVLKLFYANLYHFILTYIEHMLLLVYKIFSQLFLIFHCKLSFHIDLYRTYALISV